MFYIHVLKELHNILQLFAPRSAWFLISFSYSNNGNNGFTFRNRKHFANFIPIPKSHDQSGKTKLCSFQNQVFILKTKVITAPSISNLIIRSAVCLETGTVMYEGSDNQSCMLSFYIVIRVTQAFFTKLLTHVL